jgi:ligand-binding sensor domain-containing protein
VARRVVTGIVMPVDYLTEWPKADGLTGSVKQVIDIGECILAVTADGDSAQLFMSTDNGTKWIEVTGANVQIINSVVAFGNRIFVGTNGGLLYAGTTDEFIKVSGPRTRWIGVGEVTGSVVQTVTVHNSLFVGTSDGLFMRADKLPWRTVSGVTGTVSQVVSVHNRIYIGTSKGLLYAGRVSLR